MAEVNATFNYDADFSSAISEVKRLSQELSVLNSSFNSLDKNARVLRNDIAQTFSGAVGQIGGFSTKTVDITSNIDNFGKSLDRGKLKLRDYYREATRAFQANSNAQKLAEDQIRRTRASLVQLGIDPSGRNKGMLITPLKLDMSDMNNQLAVARKQFDIFNSLVQGGATKLINFGKNTQWAGRQLTVGITVPMSIFASTVTKAFMDVDAELTRFQKVYGSGLVASTAASTAAIRGQVVAMATEIASKYGVAAKETAGLAADLAATGLEGQNLLNSLKETTRLSVLGEVDRQTAMKATLSIQNAFKVNTKELADNINFLNAVENQTSTSLQDLTEAIPKAGPVIKALGGDVKDLSLLLVAMKEGGIGVAEGANAIKSGLASLINPTKAAIEVGQAYGINIEQIVKANKGQLMPTIIEFQNSLNTLDEFSKAQVIEKIFGKYQFARMSALFDNLNASGSQTKKVLELMSASNSQLASIANQEIKTLTESASMRFKRSMEAIRASLLPVGETILRSVLPYLEKFSSFIDRVVEVGKNLPEPIKQFIKFGTAITAIAGPLVMIGGVLANFLGYVTKGAMGFVNLGRRMAGLPTQQFTMLDDTQIAAAKATDVLTHSLDRQRNTMIPLVALMKDYVAVINAQRAATPGAFIPGTTGKPAKSVKPIKRQSGGSAWVPGSGSGDIIPALLEPGEFVVNRNAAKQNGGLLHAINSQNMKFGGIKKRDTNVQSLLDRFLSGRTSSLSDLPGLRYSSSNNPSTVFAKEKAGHTWESQRDERRAILLKSRELRAAGIDLPYKTVKDMLSIDASHIGGAASKGMIDGVPVKVWAREFLMTDYGSINKALNNTRYKLKDLALENPKFASLVDIASTPPDPNHPIDKKNASLLLEAFEIIKQRDPKYKDKSTIYADVAAATLQTRLSSSGTSFYDTLRERDYTSPNIGFTTSVSRESLGQPKTKKVRNPVTGRYESVLDSGQDFGGMTGTGFQSGAWVPGSGSGDRIPAMLEPGEFVVNRKAAMRYGGLLHDMNFNQAPRFAEGGPTGGRLSKIAGVSSVGYMLPMLIPMNEAMTKVTYGLTTLFDVVQMVSGLKGSGGLKGFSSKLSDTFGNAKANRIRGVQQLKAPTTAASRATGVIGKTGAFTGRLGMAAGGAGRLAMGALLSPVGLAVAGTVGVLALAVMKYRQEIDKSKKAAQEAFSAGKDTAAAYGIEVQSINDKLKENQEITTNLGLGKATSIDPNAISADKMSAIKSDNANLIGKLNDSRFDLNPTTTAQKASMLRTKFATLRQQGFSQRDAMEVLTGIAKEAGAETQNVLYSLKPELIKITGDTQAEVFKSAQDVQLQALKNTTIGSAAGSSEAFRETFKGIMQTVQYAAPEDQYKALENVLKTINTLDPTQITQASKALVEAATADYGSADNFTLALKNLQENGGAANLATAASLDVAKRLGIDTGYIETQLKLDLPPAEVAALKAQLDEATKQRSVIVEMQLRNSEKAQKAIDDLNGKITQSQAAMDAKLEANDKAVEKENLRFKNAAKASAKFIKDKQKEIEAINKGADAYINSLERENKKDQYIQSQRKTALSGLQALTQGDVLGFLASKQEGSANAQQYAYDQEIQQIDDKRKTAVDALQTEIDKENEKQANADENHQKRLDQLEKERLAAIKTNAEAVSGLQKQIDQYASLQSMSGTAYDSIIGNYKYAATEAEKTIAVNAALNYLMSNPNATIEQAIAVAQKGLNATVDFETARETRRAANGGHITGAGGPTDDKIPAMLSNGEYVVRASAVDQYGTGMLDQINTQKFASGGLVKPVSGRANTGYPYNPPRHLGTDFGGGGQEVHAAHSGTVSYDQITMDPDGVHSASNKNPNRRYGDGLASYGRVLRVSGNGWSTLYAHLSKAIIKSGSVKQNDAIGISGESGNAFGAHLHFEVKKDGQRVSPLSAISGRYTGDTGVDTSPEANNYQDGLADSEALDRIASAFGTTAEIYNSIKTAGLATVLTGRRFGGSMTMNKPYLVGESGPEVVMPYGFGGRVSPIKYNVPRSAMSPELMEAVNNTNIANSSSLVYNINVDAAGITDPKGLAKYIVSTIKAEENARSFGRSV